MFCPGGDEPISVAYIKVSPIESILQLGFATPKSLKPHVLLDRSVSDPFVRSSVTCEAEN